jgi:hypothetical protein
VAPMLRFALLTSVLLVGACSGSLGDTLGFGKRAPDEFAVVKRQQLIIPPDYNLRPPDPTASPPVPARADVRARATLTGQPVGSGAGRGGAAATGSAGEAILVRRTAEVARDPEIRERLALESGGPAAVDAALFQEVMAEPGAAASDASGAAREALTAPGAVGAQETPAVISRSSTPLENP